jgi:tetratricopeptide (TPR) repeat protein
MYAASVLSWFNRERCLRAAERAERISESLTDDVLRAHVRGYAGYARLIWERWSEADAEACARAFAVTRDAGEIDLFAFHVGRYVHTLTMRSEYAAAARAAEEGLTLAQLEIDTYDYLMCQFWRAWALLHLGRLDETRQIIDDATRATALNGHRRLTILFALLRAWVHEQSGEFELARDICRQSLAEARQTGYGFGELIGQVLLGFSELGLGAHCAAGRAFEEIAARLDRERMLMDWIWRMPLTWGLARLSAETGDIDAALQHGQRLLTLASESGEKTWMALAHSMLARCAVAQRRWKAGEAAMASAVALVESNDLPLASAAVRDVAAITQSPRPRADRPRTAVR